MKHVAVVVLAMLPLFNAAAAADLVAGMSISAGTGYAAHDLCTRTNVSGDPFDRVLTRYVEPKVQPLPLIWVLNSQPRQRVSATALLTTRIGVYRDGLGCTIVKNLIGEWSLRGQSFRKAAALPYSGARWPLGEGAPETTLLTASEKIVLDAHAATIFSESTTDLAKKTNAIALLVARDGHLVYERYAPGYNRNQPQIGWSMTKTLTALVAGRMEEEGLISLYSPVGLAQWKGTPKESITWTQLLNMAPGLAWTESYTGETDSDTTRMLYDHGDQARWAADHPLTSAPGTVFNYSTGFANIAMLGMRERLGGSRQAIYNYYQEKLFAPLRIVGGVIEPDAAGTPVGGARGVLRPLDWLRLGQLIANDGIWEGQRLLSENFMQFMLAPSPASATYGGYIWTRAADDVPADLRPRIPADTVFFQGYAGQTMVVVPSRHLVVLRMGVTFDKPQSVRQVFAAVADLLEQ